MLGYALAFWLGFGAAPSAPQCFCSFAFDRVRPAQLRRRKAVKHHQRSRSVAFLIDVIDFPFVGVMYAVASSPHRDLQPLNGISINQSPSTSIQGARASRQFRQPPLFAAQWETVRFLYAFIGWTSCAPFIGFDDRCWLGPRCFWKSSMLHFPSNKMSSLDAAGCSFDAAGRRTADAEMSVSCLFYRFWPIIR